MHERQAEHRVRPPDSFGESREAGALESLAERVDALGVAPQQSEEASGRKRMEGDPRVLHPLGEVKRTLAQGGILQEAREIAVSHCELAPRGELLEDGHGVPTRSPGFRDLARTPEYLRQ